MNVPQAAPDGDGGAGPAHVGTITGSTIRLNAYGLALFAFLALLARYALGIPLKLELSGAGWVAAGAVLLFSMLLHEVLHAGAALMFTARTSVVLRFRLLVWECRVGTPLSRGPYIFYSLFPAATMSAAVLAALLVAPGGQTRTGLTLLLLFSLTLGAGDYWFVRQALRFPPDATFLDEGTRISVFSKGA
jgi:hypothetical protein